MREDADGDVARVVDIMMPLQDMRKDTDSDDDDTANGHDGCCCTTREEDSNEISMLI